MTLYTSVNYVVLQKTEEDPVLISDDEVSKYCASAACGGGRGHV